MKTLPVHQRGVHATLELLDDHDAPWIRALVDEAEAAVTRPWRELIERLDRIPSRTSRARRDAALHALRAALTGRSGVGLRATQVRERLLGRACLDAAERAARLTEAAAGLSATVEDVESALWADLAAERLVAMPRGRPSERVIAADANVLLLQRALNRCHALGLRIWGNARAIARTAAVRGLMATARARGAEIELEISGPLALFHRTTVYGRALGSLVPHLAWCERFVLEASCDFGRGPARLIVRPPVLLPPGPPPRRYDSGVEERLARELGRRAPAWRVIREPTPVDAGGRLAFPDFLLEHRDTSERRWWVEIVGFWTREYLQHKLATYRAASLPRIILCIDEARTVDDGELPPEAHIVRFKRAVPVDAVMAIIERA